MRRGAGVNEEMVGMDVVDWVRKRAGLESVYGRMEKGYHWEVRERSNHTNHN